MTRKNIFIVGFSGSGKTTVGAEVANLLQWKFIDIDQQIVNKTSKSIAEIFKLNKGEQYFREIEKATLKELIHFENQIISTGGGIILDEGNLRSMLDNGYVICLDADPNTILNRLNLQSLSSDNIFRTILDSDDQLEKIIKLKNERDPIYKKSDYIIKTDGLTPREISNQIIDHWVKIYS